jgi:hypothetical protein
MRDTLGAFEARFRLPEMEETARLLKQYEESSVTHWAKQFHEASGIGALQPLTQPSSDVLRAMESMRSPWLDMQSSLKSIAGFSDRPNEPTASCRCVKLRNEPKGPGLGHHSKIRNEPKSAGWKRRSKLRNEPKTSQRPTIRRAFGHLHHFHSGRGDGRKA